MIAEPEPTDDTAGPDQDSMAQHDVDEPNDDEGSTADLRAVIRWADTVQLGAVASACRRELSAAENPRDVRVVVAGQFNKGKSSLINALVGYPTLLPVDVDVATGAWIRISFGDEVSASVVIGDTPAPRPVPADELGEWVSELGNTNNAKGVRSAEATVPAPFLQRGVELVDTPGINGLSAVHTEITLSMLPTADAVVYVVDSFSPLSAVDLDFIGSTLKVVPIVFLVLNKVDAVIDWGQVLEEDRGIVRTGLSEQLDDSFVPVSARLALRAITTSASDPQRGGAALERSGLPRLQDELVRNVVERARSVRDLMAARASLNAAAQISEVLERVRDALESRSEAAAQLDIERTTAAALASKASTCEQQLRDGFLEAEEAATNDVSDAVIDLRREYLRDIDENWKHGRLESFGTELQVALVKRSTEIRNRLEESLLELVGGLAQDMGLPDLGSVDLSGVTTRDLRGPLKPARIEGSTKQRIARQVLMSSAGGSASSSILSGALSWLAFPLSTGMIAISALFAVLDVRNATVVMEQREARRFFEESLGIWQRDLSKSLMTEARKSYKETLPVLLHEVDILVASTSTRLQELQSALSSDPEADRKALDRAKEGLEAMQRVREHAIDTIEGRR